MCPTFMWGGRELPGATAVGGGGAAAEGAELAASLSNVRSLKAGIRSALIKHREVRTHTQRG